MAQPAPKLVVGITVDQMRWDYLYRFHDRWHMDGGMRRLLDKGFNCNNTQVNYLPSQTASGHASIYTGSVPAYHGITGNNWYDNVAQSYKYCTSDSAVNNIGGTTEQGRHSPASLLGTTVCDEIRLAHNYMGKTIGVALKDRSSILPAGHSANAAYWYEDESGKWISSSFYMNALPGWVSDFRSPQKVDSLYRQGWSTLYPIESYSQSIRGDRPYMVHSFGGPQGQLPYNFSGFIGKRYDALLSMPQGNTLTTQFAMAAIKGEALGKDAITDCIAISYSSIDFIGHAYGPNAVEMEDAMLRLDMDLGNLFRFLDAEVGEGQYLVFLTADHGSAHVPGFLTEHHVPSGLVTESTLVNNLNTALKLKFGEAGLVKNVMNSQVILDIPLIDRIKKLSQADVSDFIVEWLVQQPNVSRAVRLNNIDRATLTASLHTKIANAYFPSRSGHVQIIYKPAVIEGYGSGGTTHGSPYDYDTHIPLIFYGWHVPAGSISARTNITDIAPTVAALLKVQEPSTSIGNVITQLTDKILVENQ